MTLGSLSGDGWGCVLSYLLFGLEVLNTGACSFWLELRLGPIWGPLGELLPINISGVRNSLGVQWLDWNLQVGLWTHCRVLMVTTQSPCPCYMCSQNPWCLLKWEHFSIQIFHRHWYTRLIAGIQSMDFENRDFCSSSLVTQPLGLSFGFKPTSMCGPSSGVCSLPRWEGYRTDWDLYTCSERRIRRLWFGHTHLLYWECLQFPQRQDWHVEREVTMVALPLCPTQQWHLTSKSVHASSRSFPDWGVLQPIPSGCLHTAILPLLLSLQPSLRRANSYPLSRSTLLTPGFSIQLPSALGDTHLRLGCMQGCGTDHLCKSCSVLPATDQPLHFLYSPWRPLSISVYSATGAGCPLEW